MNMVGRNMISRDRVFSSCARCALTIDGKRQNKRFAVVLSAMRVRSEARV